MQRWRKDILEQGEIEAYRPQQDNEQRRTEVQTKPITRMDLVEAAQK